MCKLPCGHIICEGREVCAFTGERFTDDVHPNVIDEPDEPDDA